jgi:signal transduction histidine kinase
MDDVIADPLSDHDIKAWTIDECQVLREHSLIAEVVSGSNLKSVVVQNLRKDGAIVAQLLIGFTASDDVSSSDIQFISRIGEQRISALINARNVDSMQDLQRQLVGQNESLAQMQDGVELSEASLRMGNERLSELNELKTQFTSEVAHEFKTPLSVIIGYADLLRHFVDDFGEEKQQFAGSIEKAARQLTSLINDLRDISLIESGHFTCTKSMHDLSSGVGEIVTGLRISNPEYAERIKYNGTPAENLVLGDPSRLGQVFTNLITNSLKYSTADQNVIVSVESDSTHVRVTVADTGYGISESDQAKLFTRYFRSSNPDVMEREGTGLGLFLSRSIIEEHEGSLNVSSVLGAGSTFVVELPIKAQTQQADVA